MSSCDSDQLDLSKALVISPSSDQDIITQGEDTASLEDTPPVTPTDDTPLHDQSEILNRDNPSTSINSDSVEVLIEEESNPNTNPTPLEEPENQIETSAPGPAEHSSTSTTSTTSPTNSRAEISFEEGEPLLPFASPSDTKTAELSTQPSTFVIAGADTTAQIQTTSTSGGVRVNNNLKPKSPSILTRTRMATSLEDIGSLRLWKGIVAEFLGTLLLTFVGCGSCINLRGDTNVTSPVVQIALCFGLSVGTIVWAICHVSGGHINPAVTMAMLATRKISVVKAIFFIIFQLIGAVVGAAILFAVTPEAHHGNLGATLVNDELTVGQGFGVELMITFVLVFTVFASCDGKRKDLNGSTPLSIGLSVTMCHLFAIDFTGSSMNTARSFGPAVVMGKWEHHWVYWVGPILGGVIAGVLYEHVMAVNASLTKAKACLLSSAYDDDKYQAQKLKIRIIEEDPNEDPNEENGLVLEDKGPGQTDATDANTSSYKEYYKQYGTNPPL